MKNKHFSKLIHGTLTCLFALMLSTAVFAQGRGHGGGVGQLRRLVKHEVRRGQIRCVDAHERDRLTVRELQMGIAIRIVCRGGNDRYSVRSGPSRRELRGSPMTSSR